jgi:NCAIR mutase (PurE)-related protein
MPVHRVRTGIGWRKLGGLSACCMLAAAPAVSVVNIDNGFRAGAIASSINHLA